MQVFNGRYIEQTLIINEWIFQKRIDSRFICSRISGVSDYIVEWWFINGKYKLYYITYNESENFQYNPLNHGTCLCTYDNLNDVLVYCCTHLHPDL